jgi:hypothetical protein
VFCSGAASQIITCQTIRLSQASDAEVLIVITNLSGRRRLSFKLNSLIMLTCGHGHLTIAGHVYS